MNHFTSDRLGAAWDQDLEVLCQDCHGDHHLAEMAASESHRIFLKLASQALVKAPYATLGELSEAVKLSCVKAHIKYEAHQVDKALSMLSGSKRVNSPIPRTVQDVREAQPGGPLTDSEARETLKRLGLGGLLKEMPRAAPSQDRQFYAPVWEDFGEHDHY